MNRINPNLNGNMIVTVVIQIQAIVNPKFNSRNRLAPNVCFFIAKLVEHCSAKAEAMRANSVEVPKFLQSNLQNVITTWTIISSFKFLFQQFTSSSF